MTLALLALWALAVAGGALVLTQSSITAPLRDGLAAAEKRLLAARVVARIARRPQAVDYGTHGAIVDAPSSWPRLPRALRWPVAAAHRLVALLAKLTACPMCSGFWIGAVAGRVLFTAPSSWTVACGFAGSLASALAVALWLWAGETTAAFGLWRYLNTPPPPDDSRELRGEPAQCCDTTDPKEPEK